jgi:hypothetical protein
VKRPLPSSTLPDAGDDDDDDDDDDDFLLFLFFKLIFAHVAEKTL